MNLPVEANLIAAWIGLLLGFLSGMVMGMFFQREDWLGGYTSFKRRLFRLGHISLFGLALINLIFYLTVKFSGISGGLVNLAGLAFIIGAIAMPVCCIVTGCASKLRMTFAIPVISLITGAVLVLTTLLQKPHGTAGPQADVRTTINHSHL